VEQQADFDAESDRLIELLVDETQSKVERTRATQNLYQRHANWVIQQIGKKIFNPDDVQDIAQTVWMLVLQPEKLGKDYKNKNGKFRAYLRAPIRWAILKHIDKLPFTVDDQGNKSSAHFTDITEAALEEKLDNNMLEEVIENIIKPNLPSVDIKSRVVYLVNEYGVIFHTDPSLREVANVNGINESEAASLHNSAKAKDTSGRSDEELSVYMPLNYRSLVNPEELKQSSGRHLANLIGITESAFRKRLHTARKFMIEIVRKDLILVTGDSQHEQ